MYNTPVSHNIDSDDSDSEEMLPMGAFWPIPEDEEWTMVERSHGSLRGAKGIDGDRFHNSGEKLDHSGLRCGQLDYINETDNHSTRSEVLLLSRREATQYDNTPPGIETAMESAIASGKPAVCKRPNVIVVVPSKITDRRVNCPVNVALTPQVMVHKSLVIGTQAEELFPEELEVVPEEMAEEASMGDLADNHPLNVYKLYTQTTVTNLPMDYDQIERLAPRRVLVEVAEEASTEDTTIEKCMYEVMDKNETKVCTELLEVPQQLVSSWSREDF